MGHAVNTSVLVADEEASFEPMHRGGVRLIGRQVDMLHKNGAWRKTPFVRGRKADLLGWRVIRAIVRYCDPTFFIGTVRPKRGVNVVWNQTRRGCERGQIGEGSHLREQSRRVGNHR